MAIHRHAILHGLPTKLMAIRPSKLVVTKDNTMFVPHILTTAKYQKQKYVKIKVVFDTVFDLGELMRR